MAASSTAQPATTSVTTSTTPAQVLGSQVVAPAPAVADDSGQLSFTGSNSRQWTGIALLILGMGLLLVSMAKRRLTS